VAVEDNAGKIKVVNHPEIDVVRRGKWQEWNIDLKHFSDAGVNLAAVKKMYIGLGNRVSPQAGGTGTIFIDDIRVYRSRPVPSECTNLAADLTGNCVVDYADIEVMANEWLTSGHLVTPQQPGNASLVAYYSLDGNTSDSSGNANHGTANGDPQWVAGKTGNALEFDGTDDEVSIPYSAALNPLDNFTVSAWAKAASGGTGHRAVISSRTEPPQKGYIVYATPANIWQFWTGTGSGWQSVSGPSVSLDEWVHLAAIYTDGTKRLYANGVLAVEAAGTYVPNDADELLIGAGANETVTHNYFFVGAIDDVRIYDSVLSAAEIAWLAGYTSPFSEPFDLNVDGVVDFQDFAQLADSWLEEQLWP